MLDGAKAIGLPCSYGQNLFISPKNKGELLHWASKTVAGDTWFDAQFSISDFSIVKTSEPDTAEVLQQILQKARQLNPIFLNDQQHALQVETHLEFPRLWGLGSSSTLIYNLAIWAGVDPLLLSSQTLGGSGYDIACAGAEQSILYQIKAGQTQIKKVAFKPIFDQHLYFIYLGKKQNSREGIKRYRAKSKQNIQDLKTISALTEAMLSSGKLEDFQALILEHERIVSKTIEMPRAQDLYFSDFEGVIKSLGAWGGDFILAATQMDRAKTALYFNKKGFETFFEYKEMILSY